MCFCFCSGPSGWLTDCCGGGTTPLMPPVLSLSPAPDIPVQTEGVQLPPGYFLPRSPSPCHPPTAIDTHGGDEQPTFNQTPKIAPGVWWVGWLQTPAGSTGVMCSSLSSHNTGRGDSRPQVHIQRPLLLQLEPQPADCGVL